MRNIEHLRHNDATVKALGLTFSELYVKLMNECDEDGIQAVSFASTRKYNCIEEALMWVSEEMIDLDDTSLTMIIGRFENQLILVAAPPTKIIQMLKRPERQEKVIYNSKHKQLNTQKPTR